MCGREDPVSYLDAPDFVRREEMLERHNHNLIFSQGQLGRRYTHKILGSKQITTFMTCTPLTGCSQ